MSAAHDHLVSLLEAMLSKLEQGDAVAVASMAKEALPHFATAKDPGSDPRVVELHRQCEAKAAALMERLHREVGAQATSRRATTAYGSQP